MDGSAVSSQVVQDLEAGSRIVSIGYIGAVNCVGAISALPVVRGPAEFRCRSPSRRGCGGLLAWLFVSSSIGDKGDMDRDIEAAGLDTLQLDHLRHFNNLSLQPPNGGLASARTILAAIAFNSPTWRMRWCSPISSGCQPRLDLRPAVREVGATGSLACTGIM
jgi:hypothetical protein